MTPTKISELKSGDVVILHRRDFLDCPKRVARVTTTQVVLDNYDKYQRQESDTANRVGRVDAWTSNWIQIPKDGEVDECRRAIIRWGILQEMREFFACQSKNTLSLENLHQIKAIITANQKTP